MEKTSLQEIFLPTKLEVLVYFVVGWLIFIFLKIELIINRLAAAPLPKEISAEDYLGSLSFLAEFPLINTAVIVIFWSGIGLAAYTLVWAIINAFIEARNEIVVESEYVNKGRFWSRFQSPLLKSGLLGLLLAWLILNFMWLLPLLLRYFSLIVVSGKGFGLLAVLVPAAVMALNLAIITLIFRMITHPSNIIHLLNPTQKEL